MVQAKKRIALAITLAEPGGAQLFLLGFAQWLKEQGHEVTILAGDGEWLFAQCRERNISTHRLRHMGRAIHPLRDARAFLELRRVLKKIKPDALHLNSTKMGIIGSVAGHAAQVPRIVYRIGGWVFLEPLSPLIKWIYLQAERWSARWKDVIVCVHPGDATLAQQFNIQPKKDVRVIANGIDLAMFDRDLKTREEARRELGLSDKTFVFGTVANFYPAKDLPRYLEACAQVHRAHPEARFLLIGEGMERATIQEQRRALGLDAVVFLPGTFDQRAREWLRGLDTFVLPSVKEGMSWALLEAMAAGLSCVVTDVGANRWMMGSDGGWIVPPQSPEALAQAMIAALEHPNKRQQRGQRARTIIEQRFPLQKTYQENEATLL